MMGNLKILLFLGAFFFVFSLSLAKEVNFTVCSGARSTATVEKAEILPCEVEYNNGTGCSLKRGENVTFRIVYTPSSNCNLVIHKVKGVIGGFPISFPGIRGNACDNHTSGCPLVQGTKVTYEAVVSILGGYPPIGVIVEYSMECNRKRLFCIRIATNIITPVGFIPTANRRRG